MAAVFDFVFELFGRLVRGRIKVYSIGFQKGELNHYFVSTARQNVSACLFSREYWSRSRGLFDGRSDSILQPCLSPIHC